MILKRTCKGQYWVFHSTRLEQQWSRDKAMYIYSVWIVLTSVRVVTWRQRAYRGVLVWVVSLHCPHTCGAESYRPPGWGWGGDRGRWGHLRGQWWKALGHGDTGPRTQLHTEEEVETQTRVEKERRGKKKTRGRGSSLNGCDQCNWICLFIGVSTNILWRRKSIVSN